MENQSPFTSAKGKFSFKKFTAKDKIIKSIFETYEPFLKVLKTHKNRNLGNEKQLTQEFIIQNDIQLSKYSLPIRIHNEYSDNFHGTKGIPDFAFLPLIEGQSHEPLFIVEAKILPTPKPSKEREETEYVFYKQDKKQGGIERFKNEKHGKGVAECGMLAFIKKGDYQFWFSEINSWIEEVSLEENYLWNKSEKLLNQNLEFNYNISEVNREKDTLKLHHFWLIVG